jgi:hypothetical protein
VPAKIPDQNLNNFSQRRKERKEKQSVGDFGCRETLEEGDCRRSFKNEPRRAFA